MAKQRKPGGRVTPKGTTNASTKKAPDKPASGKAAITHQRDLPDRVRQRRDFGGRPISHNRGNR